MQVTFNRFADMMCVSSITGAELLYGAEKSPQPEHDLRQVEAELVLYLK